VILSGEKIMWKDEYWDNDGELYRDISREDDWISSKEVGRYEIVFDFEGQRYYCFIDAINMAEALGIFFVNHDTVMYENIVDHMEI